MHPFLLAVAKAGEWKIDMSQLHLFIILKMFVAFANERGRKNNLSFQKMDLVHNLKGKLVVYCLECEPDADGRPFRYVGSTNNCERRMAEHMGVKEGGAAWCKSHKPVDVISVRVCNTKEEAAVMETMLCSLHQATIGYQQARGSRWNMNQDMKKNPPYFDKVQESFLDKPDSEASTTPPPSREESPDTPEVVLPKVLPPEYEILKQENGIVEDKPPVSCPCFNDAPDPSGRQPWLGIAVR